MKIRKVLVAFLFLILSVPSFAVDSAPLAMLKSTSNQMLRELDKHMGKLKGNYKLVNSLVNRIIVPHFDLDHMSRAVVGRTHWQQASNKTQQQFTQEFTQYIIRTYSSALQSYDGQKMKFFPIRGTIGDKVRVSSDLMLKNGPPVQLQYGLIKKGSKWLIYDFSVDGISIVKNYNSQFASTLRRSGLDGLVLQIKQRNDK